MNLSNFSTLALAKAYSETTYRKIGGNEASQLLAKTSALDSIEANTDSTTSVEVVTGDPTTVGALCRTVVRTLNGGQFSTDPNTEDGASNRGSSAVLVAVGVLTQAQVDDFYAKAETVRYPLATKTEYDFQVAKGTIAKLALRQTANGDCAIMEVFAICANHPPRVTIANGTRIGYFYNVAATGFYSFTIPNEYRGQDLFVDNAYSVIS
tara:strand:- start:3243 stop:3869 length:627 start_codon:yes stop_codon:yes gene_type:complete